MSQPANGSCVAVKSSIGHRTAVSAFGFGGTNFHAGLEEYVPS
jgi:acyl transferase domain-containing protein